MCQQLGNAIPHIAAPTPAQAALIPAMLAENDVVLRAHTGSGKSFAVLLALLAKPRLLFRTGGSAPVAGTSALVLVPSNELALQYMGWVRAMLPSALQASVDVVAQCVVRGEDTVAGNSARLRAQSPHILIGTPTRVQELLAAPAGADLLGIATLRTLVLDEADALLQLPGRFPSERQRWKHLAHRSAGLDVLNSIMTTRATFSGGARIPSAGMEHGSRADRRPPEPVRRTQHRGAEKTELAPAQPRLPGVVPLQLVCTSATANSVLRHFLGARTGWLRTNTRETRDTARWIDLTGQSGGLSNVEVPLSGALPEGMSHACIVVDEGEESSSSEAQAPSAGAPGAVEAEAHAPLVLPPLRNLDMRVERAGPPALTRRAHVVPAAEPGAHVVDMLLLEALAFAFAADGVACGLALVPPQWSIRRAHDALMALGVPVRTVAPGEPLAPRDEIVLYLLQSTSARGLDVPGLTHVFLVGLAAVGDAVHYTHAAGRVARIGTAGSARLPGRVVTLLRGVPPNAPGCISAAEQKMARIYQRLQVVPRPFDLSLAK